MTRLKFERTNRQLSQATIAALTRIAQPRVSQIETGRLTPTPAQLKRLAVALKVPASQLLEEVQVMGRRR